MSSSVLIHAPATIANMVCGFDILGLALAEPFDIMECRLLDQPGIQIRHHDGFGLPEAAEKNVAGVALIAMLEEVKEQVGVAVDITKQIKPGSGLGSSAASAAGAVAGLNQLLGSPFSSSDLVRFAMHGEKLASGVKHADNIAPCILGGITLVRSILPLDIVPLTGPSLWVAVVHPQIEVKTSDARQILRKEVPLKQAIRQWGNIAGLVAGLLKNDHDLIGRSLEDVIIEPVRSMLIPGFDAIKTGCREAGALGGGIAGSGPSIFMLARDMSTAETCADLMLKTYVSMGIECKTYVTTIRHSPIIETPNAKP